MSACTRSPGYRRLIHVELLRLHIEVDQTLAFNLEVMTERGEAQSPPHLPTAKQSKQIYVPYMHKSFLFSSFETW